MLVVESSIIIVYLRTKFMVWERGRKTDAPRYVLLTYRKIMKKFLVFLSFSPYLFFLETFQYDKRGPLYIYLYVSAKIQRSSRLVFTTQY